VPIRPFSLNAERNSRHWGRPSRNTTQARDLARDLCAEWIEAQAITWRPALRAVSIDAFPYAIDRRYRQDTGNCYPSVKACIDGLVRAGLIEDDGPEFVTFIGMHAHRFGRDALVLIIEEEK
jgi:hypothetical protein